MLEAGVWYLWYVHLHMWGYTMGWSVCVCELLYALMCVRVISEVQSVSPGDLSGHDETSQLAEIPSV
jgi:hypothetical protein